MAEKQHTGGVTSGQAEEHETYEILDLTSYARSQQWWSTVFGNNSGPIAEKYSVATQIMMGGVTGWCAGYLFQRVGKVAATAVGGGFLLLQVANHSGYVQVNWKKVEKDVNKAKKHLKKKANKAAPEINTFIEEATEFVKKNLVISSGFVGGVLPGSCFLSLFPEFVSSDAVRKKKRPLVLNQPGVSLRAHASRYIGRLLPSPRFHGGR